MRGSPVQIRCPWTTSDPLYLRYHDFEWGAPVHDDRTLFEMVVLEGAQAGLSWITILRKRENYRVAFDNFRVEAVARYDRRKVRQLLSNKGIVRNRLKIEGTIKNARAFTEVQREFGSFDRYIWRFVDGRPIVNSWKSLKDIPAKTPLSDAISKDMKKRGFTFVGSTICYAFMQAVGMVNDHTTGCFRHPKRPVSRVRAASSIMARRKWKETYPAIWAAVCRIPRGRVSSYGRVASLAGFAAQPRLAGYALHNIPPGSDIPWHRVLNAQGKISLPGAAGKKQQELLEHEGVVFLRGRVNLDRHGWPRQKGVLHGSSSRSR